MFSTSETQVRDIQHRLASELLTARTEITCRKNYCTMLLETPFCDIICFYLETLTQMILKMGSVWWLVVALREETFPGLFFVSALSGYRRDCR